MILGLAIVIPPLLTIQVQMASTCEQWSIPYLNLAEVHAPSDIPQRLSEVAPKVVLCSIEAISDPAVQSQLQSVNVEYIAVDESQVGCSPMIHIHIDHSRSRNDSGPNSSAEYFSL